MLDGDLGMSQQDWSIVGAAIGFMLGVIFVLALHLVSSHPADACQEDGAWIAVDHHALDGTEDRHGVTRACRSIDDMLDSAIEVWIQNG